VVPTRDGGARWERCARALGAQEPPLEGLCVVDSGSRDGSDEVARRAGAHLVAIAPEAFDHGATRALGARGLPPVDVVVFLVQDAIPRGPAFARTLARAALADGVAAATARQVAPPEARWPTQVTVGASPFASRERVRTGPFTPAELDAMPPARRREVVRLDDVACAVRADVFAAIGFPRTPHGEDVLLAWALLRTGWALAHEPDAVVEHGHEYTPEAARERYRADAAFFREWFDLRVRPTRPSAWKGYLAARRADRRWLAAHPGHAGPGAAALSRALRRAQVEGQRAGSAGPLGGGKLDAWARTVRDEAPRPAPAGPSRGVR